MSGCVSVAMDKEQIEFGFSRKYDAYFPLQHRASTFPRIPYGGKRDS